MKTKPNNVFQCIGAQNNTVDDCPVNSFKEQEFIVAVYNSQIRANKGLIKILLPHSKYKAQIFDKQSQKFVDTPFDILE